MAEATPKPIWMFYWLQGERGEDRTRPNACQITALSPDHVTLAEVLSSFTLRGTGSFHFRFQQDVDGQALFVDVVDPSEAVPRVGGNIVARVLRLDNVKCATRLGYQLALRSDVGAQVAGPSKTAHVAASSAAPTPAQKGPPAGVQRTAATNRGVAGSSGLAPSPSIAPVSSSRSVQPPVVPTQVPKTTTSSPSVVVPDVVDPDLADKSDFVKAEVMKRRTELRRAQNAAIAEVEERERAARAEQEFKDSAKTTLGPRLSEWSQESSGRKKDIRALLATMHTVLWEGASWEPASMSKLLIPAKVRFFYLKAVRIVHPDKHNTMDAAQRFAAEAIFHALETAYRVFEESEMAGGAGASGAASPNNVISSL